MSHFAVLVVGEVEHNLAPFHEFECTGTDNEFVQDVDQTEEARADYESHKDDPEYPTFADFIERWYGLPAVAFGEQPDLTSAEKHKYGYAQLDEAGEIVKVIKRTNPNKKWNWYGEGGRWSGLLLTKDGKRVDSAQKGEIDFDTMRKEADDKRRAEYKDSGYNPSMTWRPTTRAQRTSSVSLPASCPGTTSARRPTPSRPMRPIAPASRFRAACSGWACAAPLGRWPSPRGPRAVATPVCTAASVARPAASTRSSRPTRRC